MSDDELAMFDLLHRDNITKVDRERLKQASRSLLASLRVRYGKYARSAYRHRAHPDATSSDFGCRVVITIPDANRGASGR